MTGKKLKNYRSKFVSILLLLGGFASHSSAQSFNAFTSFYKKTEDVKTGELNFRFESLGFFPEQRICKQPGRWIHADRSNAQAKIDLFAG